MMDIGTKVEIRLGKPEDTFLHAIGEVIPYTDLPAKNREGRNQLGKNQTPIRIVKSFCGWAVGDTYAMRNDWLTTEPVIHETPIP